MDTRLLLSILLISQLWYACTCEADIFGERPKVQVPITSSPNQLNFTVGDTLWWEGNFSDQVAVLGTNAEMNLKNFNFFSEYYISRISAHLDQSTPTMEVFPVIGEVALRTSSVSPEPFYEINLVEEDNRYAFKFGVVLLAPGTYVSGMATLQTKYETYDHPAVFACNKRRREAFIINYNNSSTDRLAFETLYLPLDNPERAMPLSFERYARVGNVTFVVTE